MEYKTNVQQKLEAKNAKTVNYAFLTPVTDYVAKVYGDIKEDLDRYDYAEIMQEIREKNTLVIKKQKNELGVVSNTKSIEGYSKYSRYSDKDEKKRKEEPITLSVSTLGYSNISEGHEPRWGYEQTVIITDLYYITDYDKYANYILELISKTATERIEKINKQTSEEKEKLSSVFTDLKTFDIKTLDFTKLQKERIVRELEAKDTTAARKLEIISNLVEEDDGCTWNMCSPKAYFH